MAALIFLLENLGMKKNTSQTADPPPIPISGIHHQLHDDGVEIARRENQRDQGTHEEADVTETSALALSRLS